MSKGEGEPSTHKCRVRLLSVCLSVNPVGEPDALIGHVRFDERGWETERWPQAPSYRAHPRLYSTRLGHRPVTPFVIRLLHRRRGGWTWAHQAPSPWRSGNGKTRKAKRWEKAAGTGQDCLAEPAGKSINLFTASTLSYTDTWTIGWFFLIRIPTASAAYAVPYEPFVCRSTWSKYRPTSGRLR